MESYPLTSDFYIGTDELIAEFYQCPVCDFRRIPHLQTTKFARSQVDNEHEFTATFCPGCGRTLEWSL